MTQKKKMYIVITRVIVEDYLYVFLFRCCIAKKISLIFI